MQVTIEGVVDSSAIAAGQRTTVELTGPVRNMLRAGLVRVIEWHHPEPEPKPARRPRRRRAPKDE